MRITHFIRNACGCTHSSRALQPNQTEPAEPGTQPDCVSGDVLCTVTEHLACKMHFPRAHCAGIGNGARRTERNGSRWNRVNERCDAKRCDAMQQQRCHRHTLSEDVHAARAEGVSPWRQCQPAPNKLGVRVFRYSNYPMWSNPICYLRWILIGKVLLNNKMIIPIYHELKGRFTQLWSFSQARCFWLDIRRYRSTEC